MQAFFRVYKAVFWGTADLLTVGGLPAAPEAVPLLFAKVIDDAEAGSAESGLHLCLTSVDNARADEIPGGGEELSVVYQTVGTVTDPRASADIIADQLAEHMDSHREAEWATGRCLSGVHKDDLQISINGQEARKYASQGQARTAAISLKMAERDILQKDTGEYPVLLLDDVLSELDLKRQDYILNRSGTGQVLITCCEEQTVAEKTGGRILRVAGGAVNETV